MDEFGKVCAEMSYLQSQMHSDHDSAESIADSDLEDGELQKMLASPLYVQSPVDCESSRMPIAPGKPAALLQERGAKRTQAALRKSLMSSSSQKPSAPEKPAAMFSLGSEEPGNQFKSSIFKNADPSNLARSLIEGNKDHVLNQARSELMRQEHQVGSRNICISELQQQPRAHRLELQDAQHRYIESRREQVRLQELSVKEKVLRDTQIRSMHETGEMKRAQEQRVDEFSVQKCRENHETIQKLTSQLHEMQDQMKFYEWFRRISRSGSKLQWVVVSRFQLACNDSKFSFLAEPRQTLASWHMEYIWIAGKGF